jgi:hypothetical protein
MSTLPPEPSYNPNIPIISSAGGTAVAYKDPNSPESIMKKATLVQAQGQVDTKFDVNLDAVEGFSKQTTPTDVYILYVFVTLLLITLFTQTTKIRKIFILSLASVLLLISIYLLQRNVRL